MSANSLDRIATAFEQAVPLLQCLTDDVHRIAEKVAPPPPDLVGSVYVAKRLGVTTVWVAEMARKETIPTACIVPGTGIGKPWKFYRQKIDRWIESGRTAA